MERINMINVIPESASASEGAFYVIEHAERTYNEMWREIGISELRSLEETGNMVLYEADEEKAKSIKDSILAWLESFWGTVKGLYESFLKKLDTLVKETKTKLDKIGMKNKEALKKHLSGLKYGKTYGKAYKWGSEFNDACKGGGKVGRVMARFDQYFSNVYNSQELTKEAIEKVKSQLDIVKSESFEILGVKETSQVQGKVLEIMRGEEVAVDDAYIKTNFDELWKYATDFGASSAKLKDKLKHSKKSFDEAARKIRTFKPAKKEANLKILVNTIKESRAILVHMDNAAMRAVRERALISARIMLRLAIVAKAKEEKDAAKEKSVGESFTGSDIAAQITGLFA